MTREFNQNQRYDSRPPYRGSSSNNRYGAEQLSGPTRSRLNRATVDRAWENGAPHRHADYKPRHSNEADTTQTNYRPNSQRNWRKSQPSEQSSHNQTPYERGDNKRASQHNNFHNTQPHRSDYSSDGYQDSRLRSAQPNKSFADRPPHHDQRGNGNQENTYRTRNGHPNFNHRQQETNRERHYEHPYQEQSQQENHRNRAYTHRSNPTNRTNNAPDRRDQRAQPYDQREALPSSRNYRFEGRQRPYPNEPRHRSYPATPGKQQEYRNNRQSEQFEGDYEQFNHAPSDHPRDDRRQEQHAPHVHSNRTGKPSEAGRHVTPLPDGRVLKGPRPAQRKNAQFWTDISQDSEKLVSQVQTPQEPSAKVTDEPASTSASPITQSAPATHVVSPRAQAAKRAATAARQGKTNRPVSSGPRPSQRGFKWPSPPAQP